MTLNLILDQIFSWIIVAQCWWITHQIYDAKGGLGLLLMRLGVAALGVSLAIVTALRLAGVVFIAGAIWKAALAVLFAGVILFHWKRFRRV
ncbi:MAG: hypothetical protein ABNH53_01330 [Henriciella sp.]|jgi:hypothetical protein